MVLLQKGGNNSFICFVISFLMINRWIKKQKLCIVRSDTLARKTSANIGIIRNISRLILIIDDAKFGNGDASLIGISSLAFIVVLMLEYPRRRF